MLPRQGRDYFIFDPHWLLDHVLYIYFSREGMAEAFHRQEKGVLANWVACMMANISIQVCHRY